MKNRSIFLITAVIFLVFNGCTKQTSDTGKFETRYIYSDGSALYRSPSEPSADDPVTVKIRTKRDDLTEVLVHYSDKTVRMKKLASEGDFDYYFAEIPPVKELTGYYYQISRNNQTVYYSRKGIELKVPTSSYRFRIIPGFDVPDWMKGAVLYQIYIDRFYNGDPSNDVLTNEYMYDNWPSVRVDDWNSYPDSAIPYAEGGNRTREFYGGDIDGVIEKLDYLKDLGIDGIYFNPLFVSPSNHKYDAQDYEYIDPHLGVIVEDGGELINPRLDPMYGVGTFGNTSVINSKASKYIKRTTSLKNLEASNEKMAELIEEAHKRGIRVLLDGVFNHCGSFNKWLDREGLYPGSSGPGAYESAESPFKDYFVFSEDSWPDNESYEAWWGYKTLPKLNFEGSPDLLDTILKIGAKWVGPGYNADGWRLDVAADLGHSAKYNHLFWEMFRESVKKANPDAVILAEVYGDSSAWLMGTEWDSVMNYDAFFEPVGFYLTGMEKHSYYYKPEVHNNTNNFKNELMEKMAKLPYLSLEIAMNQLDNHDHSRFLTRTSGAVDMDRSNSDRSDAAAADRGNNKGILKEAVILQMTLPGAPTLYYGNEAGVAGFTDPDSRRTYPWGNEDQELLSFYKEIISLHKKYSSISGGALKILLAKNSGVFAFGRWDLNNRVVVALNNNDKAVTAEIPLWSMGFEKGDKLDFVFRSAEDSHDNPGTSIVNGGSGMIVEIPPYGGIICVSEQGSDEPAAEITGRPEVKNVSPSGGAENVDPDSGISIEFTDMMRQRMIADVFRIEPDIPGKFHWNGTVVTFVPDKKLDSASRYRVIIEEDIRSLNGNFSLDKGMEWSFSTR